MPPSSDSLVEAVLQPVRDHMAFESCIERLGSAIQLGIFEPGSMLPPERVLAEKLKVSRATLREAISALRAAGLVATTRGRGGGTIVGLLADARLPRQTRNEDRRSEIDDILLFRRVIEPGACHQAAFMPMTDAVHALLTGCLADLADAASPGEYRQADARLHLTIASICGSDELTKSSSLVQTRVHQFLADIPFLHKNIESSDEQHREIVRSIIAGEADTARHVMEVHCDATAALLKGLLG